MPKTTVPDEATATEEWLDSLEPAALDFRDGSRLRAIIAAREKIEQAERDLRAAVAEARAAGDSWSTIGAALNVSKQAAQMRFGKDHTATSTELAAAARVAPAATGGWALERAVGALIETTATKDAAVKRAREIVRKSGGGDIIVCNRDGRTSRIHVKNRAVGKLYRKG